MLLTKLPCWGRRMVSGRPTGTIPAVQFGYWYCSTTLQSMVMQDFWRGWGRQYPRKIWLKFVMSTTLCSVVSQAGILEQNHQQLGKFLLFLAKITVCIWWSFLIKFIKNLFQGNPKLLQCFSDFEVLMAYIDVSRKMQSCLVYSLHLVIRKEEDQCRLQWKSKVA